MSLKKITRLVAVFAAFPGSAFAQSTLTPDEEAMLPRVVDQACLELVEAENGCEEVFLLGTADGTADLVILPDSRNDANAAPLLLARNFVFNGPMWGQSPSISQRDNGSLVIASEQSAVGRSVWEIQLTLVWRQGQFLIAGVTYQDRDKISLSGISCDVNLLSGGWETMLSPPVNPDDESAPTPDPIVKTGKMAAGGIPAKDWTWDTDLPQPCLDVSGAQWDLIGAMDQ